MKKIIKFLGTLVGAALGFFVVTFGVYFFNLDMKLTSFLEPYLDKVYDKRERVRRL